ncbi:MAG: Spy/CpxP family protein refolding chaperone [Dictyoglomus turgidum]|jgi:predicted  nucleic acid-binding Zn-ribbon protein
MKKVVKILGVVLVLLTMMLAFSYASSFRSTPMVQRERIRVIERDRLMLQNSLQFSQEFRNLIRERDRIQAQIQLLLRSGKVNSDELQKYLTQLEDIENKLFAEFKKDLINNLSNALKLKEEQRQKVAEILNKYMDDIRNLRIELRNKNLEMRALGINEQSKQREIKDKIQKLKNEIREKRTAMLNELKQVLDQNQFRILTRIMWRYNIKIKVF